MAKTMMWRSLALLLPALCAQAASPQAGSGLSFFHNDWELACDNTRTCRAAGYQVDNGEMAVSVLLTRKAGAGTAVSGEVMLGSYGDDDAGSKLPAGARLTMKIDDRAVGTVTLDDTLGKLSAAQVAALLKALTGTASIAWELGDQRWELSGKGAAAVLLKMDDFQGRVGTTGALVRKGSKGEEGVLPPLPEPVLKIPTLPKTQPADEALFKDKARRKALLDALRASVKEDDCSDLDENSENGPPTLTVNRLSETKLLVSASCWRAAYNFGSGFWVINQTLPYQPVLVTTSGSDYSAGSISASHKGRGLGDCWLTEEWAWDGQQFVHTKLSTTGMCRLIAAGGAWSLPTIVTKVQYPGQ